MLRAVARGLLILLPACAPEPAHDPVNAASSRLEAGDHQGALEAARAALRDRPNDPALRLLMARIYLASGRGDLAEVAIEQAAERGAGEGSLLLLRAQALFAQGRSAEILALTADGRLTPADRVRLLHLKARAQASMSSEEHLEDSLTGTYLTLLAAAEALPEQTIADVLAALHAERGDVPELERAWQHHACSKHAAAATYWRPDDAALTNRRVIRVGPAHPVRTPAEAARIAADGDAVLLESGTYPTGIALWPQSDLLIRGLGERPLVTADGKGVEERDVWLFTGDRVTVENVEIRGARSPYRNGAGIRHTGRGLTLRHVRLADNENGLLTGNRHLDSEILIEHSEFAFNGDGIGQAHNVYVGKSARLVFRYNYSHGADVGHLLKSRARNNVITYNRLADGPGGRSSYLIDLPEAGTAVVLGNELEQAAAAPNRTMISFGSETHGSPDDDLLVAGNTIYNRALNATLVNNHTRAVVRLVNNLMGGAPAALVQGPHEEHHNLTLPEHGLLDPRNYEYSLVSGAAAIDAGARDVAIELEYVHPLGYRPRPVIWKPDVGAHERCGI